MITVEHLIASQETRRPSYRMVSKQLPVAHLIDALTARDPSLAQDELLNQAMQRFSDPHKRWEAVRHGRARLVTGLIFDESSNAIIPHTGWEGNYVGSGLSPQDIIKEQASLGLSIMSSMERNSPIAFSSVRRIVEKGQGFSLASLREMEIYFKLIKARFDAINPSSEAVSFRAQTASIVMVMPSIELKREEGFIAQTLPLPAEDGQTSSDLTHVVLSWRERAGYHFMARVGIVGNPIIRAILEKEAEIELKRDEDGRKARLQIQQARSL